MARPVRLGMLTPSSNTTLEPVTAAMLAAVPGVTAHFGRFKVTEIALSQSALAQFDDTEILRAAELLAHAKVDVIAWNGTSAAWLGLDRDARLVARIEAATGIKAVTCVLAYAEIFARTKPERIGLVSPYTRDVQAAIRTTWAGAGFTCSAERHLGIADNFSFALVGESDIERMLREVAGEGCDAAMILCTNLAGARIAARLEAELGLPIYDSVAVTLWKCLQAANVPPARVQGWGRLFADLG